eukprot:CAMPEP_0198504242 /NCGR_PEP_ID=MMETSP1462-20131121/10393_1 /TAXON_ID=1333877 /ORGANISM="Brandtodinium nutriculum, Strain RCC3387" /LENGTH=80 /DNA_ID=CAMNT_0044233405 /DNA_START=119 /DNA_END=358 /DNA_ORIENTATION=+
MHQSQHEQAGGAASSSTGPSVRRGSPSPAGPNERHPEARSSGDDAARDARAVGRGAEAPGDQQGPRQAGAGRGGWRGTGR